jgi:hypothetical protein
VRDLASPQFRLHDLVLQARARSPGETVLGLGERAAEGRRGAPRDPLPPHPRFRRRGAPGELSAQGSAITRADGNRQGGRARRHGEPRAVQVSLGQLGRARAGALPPMRRDRPGPGLEGRGENRGRNRRSPLAARTRCLPGDDQRSSSGAPRDRRSQRHRRRAWDRAPRHVQRLRSHRCARRSPSGAYRLRRLEGVRRAQGDREGPRARPATGARPKARRLRPASRGGSP